MGWIPFWSFFYSKVSRNISLIFFTFTRSNKQFRNYEFEFHESFDQFSEVSSQIIWSVKTSVKVRFSKKATKFEINPTCFDIYSVTSKQVGDFFEILWPSQNILTENFRIHSFGIGCWIWWARYFLRKYNWRKNFATLYICTPKIKLNYFMHCLREGF